MARGARNGFTVIEAVVSVGLSALFMLLAAQLLRDTQLVTVATRRQALDPTPQHLTQRLRRDVQRSTGTLHLRGSVSSLWSSGPLTLTLPHGGAVRYERTGDRISRLLFDHRGARVGERELMRGIVSWRWVELGPHLFELEIGYRRQPDGDALRRTVAVDRSAVEIVRMRVAMRAAPGRRSW